MKLNPQKAPLYGDSPLTVLLTEEVKSENDVAFYLLFAGSTLKHLASTRKVDSGTLETVTPGHDCCETVKVSLCASRKGFPVLVVAEESFQFIQDEAYDAAQFLAANAGNQQALIFTRFLDRSRPPSGDATLLDEKVTLAFQHLSLPDEWNVLGTKNYLNEGIPRETLMHFAARLGLLRLAWFLLQQPGGRASLSVENNEGATPVSLALERGFQHLHQLLTDKESGEPDSWSDISHAIHSGDFRVKHHRGLNVYTLTQKCREGAESSMEDNIGELRKRMKSHSQHLRAATKSQSVQKTSDEFNNVGLGAEQSQDTKMQSSAEMEAGGVNGLTTVTSASTEYLSADNRTDTAAEVRGPSGNQPSTRGGEITALPSESKNKNSETEEEEVGQAPIVLSENMSDKNEHSNTDIGVNGPESVSSCGNTNEEAESTSTGLVLDQESLCSGDKTNQEADTVGESTTENVATEETINKTHAIKEKIDMGQIVSSNCTGSAETMQTKEQMENGDLEIVVVGTGCLEELPILSETAILIDTTEHFTGYVNEGGGKGTESVSLEGMQTHEHVQEKVNCKSRDTADNNGDNNEDSGKSLASEKMENDVGNNFGNESVVQEIHGDFPGGAEQMLVIKETKDEKFPSGEDRGAIEKDGNDESNALETKKDENTSEELNEVNLRKRMAVTGNNITKGENDAFDKLADKSTAESVLSYEGAEPREGSASSLEAWAGSETASRSSTEKVHTEQVDQETESQAVANEMLESFNVSSSSSVFSCVSAQGVSCSDALPFQAEKVLAQEQISTSGSSTVHEEQDSLKNLSSETWTVPSVPTVVQEIAIDTCCLHKDNKQEQQSLDEDKNAIVPSTGQEASVHNNDNEASLHPKNEQCLEDKLPDTPSYNGESEQTQEVEAETAVPTDQNTVIEKNIVLGSVLPTSCQNEKDQQGQSILHSSLTEEIGPFQVLCKSEGIGAGLIFSEAALSKSSEGQDQNEPNVVASEEQDLKLLKERALDKEINNVLAEDVVQNELALEPDGAQREDDGILAMMVKQESDLSQCPQTSSPSGVVQEPAEVPARSHEEEPEDPAQALPLDHAALPPHHAALPSDNAALPLDHAALPPHHAALPSDHAALPPDHAALPPDHAALPPDHAALPPDHAKQEEDLEGVEIPRACLHTIAEEALCESDSSTDTTSTNSDTESCSSGTETEGRSPQPNENKLQQTQTILDMLAPLNTTVSEESVDHQTFIKMPMQTADGTMDINSESVKSVGVLGTAQDFVQSRGFSESWKCGDMERESKITKSNTVMQKDEGDLDLANRTEEGKSLSLNLSEIEAVIENLGMKTEDEVDFIKNLEKSSDLINRGSWCSEPCPDDSLLEAKQSSDSTECDGFLEDGLGSNSSSSQGVFKRESGSDSDIFHLSGEGMEDMVFIKPEEDHSACDITSSSSSADDMVSLERNSSHGSDISLPHGLSLKWHKDRHSLDSNSSGAMAAAPERHESGPAGTGEMEGEEMDSITEVPAHSSLSRNSMRSLSPFRRHSWGPGKNAGNETEINQRSSMRFLGDVVKKPPIHRRSMSWCPSDALCIPTGGEFNYRSYSLEGLVGDADEKKCSSSLEPSSLSSTELRIPVVANDEDGSLISLTEEELESVRRDARAFSHQAHQTSHPRGLSYSTSALCSPLTKSMSLMAISQPGLENNRCFTGTTSTLAQSISEESCNQLPPSPSRKDVDGKGPTKVSRTFSYLRNKMSSNKKSKQEKEKDKIKEKEKDAKEKEKDKKTPNGHSFSTVPVVGPVYCYHCSKNFTSKEAYLCANCNSIVHKGCRENYMACAKVKMKYSRGPQAQDSSSLPTVIMRNKSSQPKERPRSAIVVPDENTISMLLNNRRPQTNALVLSKSMSIQNIAGAGMDENALSTWRVLSQSTDSLHKINKVNESMESLTDEGTDMNEGQLMGDFEVDSKQLEAESWSQVVDSKFLKQQKKDVVKRQDVIYELMQTEMHHVRTLKIMSDVYSRGMLTELQFEQQMVEKIFPCLDDLLNIHSQFFQRILERKRESLSEKSEKNFVIKKIGDVLVNQFSGENAERMKKTYGKFCGHHNEAMNYFKDLHAKEKRFQAFVKKKMSSSVVRRLGIPECILLVTQRITKYPVLLQRMLQYTKENEVDSEHVTQSLHLVKDVIAAVNSKVSNYEKKKRLHEIYNRTDSKSIQRMKSGQMFAKEDLKRRKLVRDGTVSLKTAAGRLKEVQAVLLSDVLVFLQEKDQKYVFSSLDQKSTVISLKRLIVRDVAHEERGLFLISMGGKDPEMVEVYASSKEERNSWIQIIQDTMNTMDKDEDEGIPSESEEEKKVLDTKARELKEQLQQKDQQILVLLEEKEKIFRDLTDCNGLDDGCPVPAARVLFRANTEEAPKGEPTMKKAIKEVEMLQIMVNKSIAGTLGQQASSPPELEGGVGPVFLPRRAETFGGFDSHQMNASRNGEKDEGEDGQDLRRTESDSVLKKSGNANLILLKRHNEQVLHSVAQLHELLSTLQAVVLLQDTYIEDQKLLLSERALTRTLSRPNSLIEQEKQRSLEKQRQELANLQKQQAQHLEAKRKREKEWDVREKELTEKEARLAQREELASKAKQDLEKERDELQVRKEEYQRDLERLRTAQKQLEREQEQLKRDTERAAQRPTEVDIKQASYQHDKTGRTSSIPVDYTKRHSSFSPNPDHLDAELSVSPKRDSLLRTDCKQKGKGPFHLLSSTNQSNKSAEAPNQIPSRLFGLSKPKEKKEKKKKNKGSHPQPSDAHSSEAAPDGEEIFC
uniref:A-kinase anchor protein 13 isoform X2 n=1 Tax=Geotrypetes seraphini TaxID=260995 RepID=A0A6P8NWF5_GEOSA|nr:A-kinase anchor protein 13 isoform X2 [Geotrypetes seraphini]